MSKQDYDKLVVWQDVLDEVMAGRTQGHRCPECHAKGLKVERTPAKVSIKCEECGVHFEGRLQV